MFDISPSCLPGRPWRGVRLLLCQAQPLESWVGKVLRDGSLGRVIIEDILMASDESSRSLKTY